MSVDMSKHFSTSALIKFTLPTIAMMIFTSCYTIVDGFFVSNYAGKTALAAVNFIFPAVMILASVGMMIGTGGSALVARTLGEGDSGRAQRYFSMLVYVTIGGGIVFSVLGLLFLRPIAVLLGAQGAMLEDCVVYGGILLAGQTLLIFLFTYFVIFNIMGRDYDAAVIAAGVCGFGMGATPNAMANMQALCEKYAPSVKAYLLIPLVGSLFADFLNSLVITFFINFI